MITYNKAWEVAQAYLIAIGLVILAILLTLLLDPLLKTPLFAFFYLAVFLSTWYGGRPSGLTASLLSYLAINYLIIAPRYVLGFKDIGELIRLGAFILFVLLISSLKKNLTTVERRLEKNLQTLQQSEERLQTALTNAPFPMIIHAENGQILQINRAWSELSGYSYAEIPTIADWIQKAYGRESDNMRDYIEQLYSLDERLDEGEFTIQTSTGEHRVWDFSSLALGQLSDGRRLVMSMASDVTERKNTENRLKEQADLLNLVYEAIFVRDAHSEIVFWNQSAQQMYGWTEQEAKGKVTHSLLKTKFPPFCDNLDEILRASGQWEGELTHTRRDGTQIIVDSRQVLVRDSQGQVKGILEVNRDITERKRTERKLYHNALHDALTGLPNRILLMERVEQAIQRAKRRKNYCFAVLFIDLDRFKNINDSLGHIVGDQLLVAIAHRLLECVRASDTVARLGGDEFIIFLDELGQEKEAFKITERIIEQLKTSLFVDGLEVFTTASIGIAFNSDDNHSATEILRNADLAMYRAKEQGKARYAVYNAAMYTEAQTIWELENNLRLALERQEFLLHYQPIFSLTTQTLMGFEALIRWQHPQQGLISPVDFIPIAEETGLIVPIGEWVLQESCRQFALWQQQYPHISDLKISVNLSGRQLQTGNLIDLLDKILLQTGLSGNSLKLEITETLLMKNLESASLLLSKLKERAIQVSIDDFGTGYSSLSYLCHLPVNTLKIDRSFVTHVNEIKENLQIVKAIIGLARQLEINVVAEGIETQQHLDRLQELECEYGQGYLFSKPLEEKAVESLLEQSLN
ncbi:EAL domain-containing protein [Gloeothece verrucosa]|uniref:Diguanylate cyclase/phosphodiesterase with PAS/PAC sensor(S) n=1 Tax=Gloeothece verrucosa (strain PCC 7822) TaxID=497965 RepID=E0UGH5_GLOV7|nr:EAL domain-containing protein [Gloeothece verrucosa]ADN12070.1 diguanylate cyclase/phosphodiesterase with PAS/PAC sensor(s) [Gloeothece verrucosa PCC 7822]